MLAAQKNTNHKPYLKNKAREAVIITKTNSADKTSFPKKVKAMNRLLAKATILSQ